MVLQQQTSVNFWGWADPGEKVSILASWNKKALETVADKNGDWKVTLHTPKAGGPFTIVVQGKNKIELSNVMTGEVWVCGGQSNMHYPMAPLDKTWSLGVLNYEKEIAEANYPKIRLFTVERKTSETPFKDVVGKWDECNPGTIRDFTAVGYFFGRELFRNMDIPIGLISSNWGGTPAESWTRKDILEKDTLFRPILERYKKALEDYPQARKEYAEALKKWKEDVASGMITGEKAKQAPRAPLGPGSNKAPYVLYNAMIAPIVNFTIKGVIWYQGENNADRAWQYRKLFPTMIANWRNDWREGNFPFYFVQIAPHRSQNPEIREAQLMTFRSVPNTGMAVITDHGDSTNIHPLNKQVVGYRLSLWALAKDYGKSNLVYSGPLYKSFKKEGNKIRVYFDFVGSGLVCQGDSLTHFTIAGADQKFVKAIAKIDGNSVLVWNSDVSDPVAVRFAWENIPMPNFFNKEGLPASPFRTDDWPGKTFGKK